MSSDWTDNPRLGAWLAAQEAAFPAWVAGTGQEWDFSPASVDRLEELIRGRFASYDEIAAAEKTPAVTVPAWYFGEVQNRHCGTGWEARPEGDANPFVRLPAEDDDVDEDEELYEDEDYVPACDPVVELTALFLRGPDNHLRTVLNQY